MKKIIGGKRYDTDTAKLIGEHSLDDVRSFSWYRETLYQKKTGEFFLHGVGHAGSKYSKRIEQNTWTGSEELVPLSYEDATEWGEKYMDADDYESVFGSVSEDEGNVIVTISLPAWAAKAIKTMAAKEGKTQGEIIAGLIPTE